VSTPLRTRLSRARGRLARALALLVLGFIAATSLPVLAMRWVDPWTSTFMIAARKDAVLAGDWRSANRYEWRDFDAIAPHAAVAVIAAEDQLFPFHSGFDLDSIRDAMQSNANSKRVRGASTITQQVAKNLFLWKGRSWLRKGLEAWFTLLIEFCWTKQRILEVYLNIAEFGPRLYGAEAAAQQFFGRPAAKLTRRQAALLAAVLPNPKRFSVAAPSNYVRRRATWIEVQMRALGGKTYLEQLEHPTAPPRGRGQTQGS
jgi:monofunctional biosynthetic peptidoglycan transglycosylase